MKRIYKAINEGLNLIDFGNDKISKSLHTESLPILDIIKKAIYEKNIFIPKEVPTYVKNIDYNIEIEDNTIIINASCTNTYTYFNGTSPIMIRVNNNNITIETFENVTNNMAFYHSGKDSEFNSIDLSCLADYAKDFLELKTISGCLNLIYKKHISHFHTTNQIFNVGIDNIQKLYVSDKAALDFIGIILNIDFVFDRSEIKYDYFNNKIDDEAQNRPRCLILGKSDIDISLDLYYSITSYFNKNIDWIFPDRKFFINFKINELYLYKNLPDMETFILDNKIKFNLSDIYKFKSKFKLNNFEITNISDDKEISRYISAYAGNYASQLDCNTKLTEENRRKKIILACQDFAYVLYFAKMPFYRDYLEHCILNNVQPSCVYNFSFFTHSVYSKVQAFWYIWELIHSNTNVSSKELLDISEYIYNFLLKYGEDDAAKFTLEHKGYRKKKKLSEGLNLINFENSKILKSSNIDNDLKNFKIGDNIYYDPKIGYNNINKGQEVAICLDPDNDIYVMPYHDLLSEKNHWAYSCSDLYTDKIPTTDNGWENTLYIKRHYNINGTLWEKLHINEYIPSKNELYHIINCINEYGKTFENIRRLRVFGNHSFYTSSLSQLTKNDAIYALTHKSDKIVVNFYSIDKRFTIYYAMVLLNIHMRP